MLKIYCVHKEAPDFGVDYVQRLFNGVSKHLPGVPFVCISDCPTPTGVEWQYLKWNWPGWWSKLSLCDPAIEGDILYMDLDSVVVGDLSDIASVGKLAMLTDFYYPRRLNSSLMYLPEKDRAVAWKAWIQDPQKHMELCGDYGDQRFFEYTFRNKPIRFQEYCPGQIVSYKVDIRYPHQHKREKGNGEIPEGTRLVCFHGKPRPRDLNWLSDKEI